MSAQHLTRDICLARNIYVFFKVATHTCSQSYCKKPERRRVVVDGEEQMEETPRECRFGYPQPLLCFMTICCVRGHLEKDIYPSRDVWRTCISPGIDILLSVFSSAQKKKLKGLLVIEIAQPSQPVLFDFTALDLLIL